VKIVNRSKTAVSFSLEECLANLRTRGVNLPMTHGDVYLRAAESTVLQLNFRPSMRLRPFTEDVAVRLAGVSHTLLQVSGACLGVEAKLANEQIAFGPVVRGSRLVKHVVISNTGDVGTKFAWNATQLSPHFSVVPTDGFLSPNQDLRLEVHFHPTELASEIRRDKMRCTVEGGNTQFLTLTGACVDAEQDATPVSFQTQVSESKPAFPLAKLLGGVAPPAALVSVDALSCTSVLAASTCAKRGNVAPRFLCASLSGCSVWGLSELFRCE